MKVLLIRPPVHCSSLDYPSGPKFGIPLGILYLASACEIDGIEVEVYDSLIDFEWENIKKNDTGSFHIGASWDRIQKVITESSADIVGVSNPFSDYVDYAITCAEIARKALPQSKVVVGGPHATSCPESFLYDGSPIDIVSRAEGEESFPLMVKAITGELSLSDVHGISYRHNNELIHTPPMPFIKSLDELPLPAYHLVNMERYFELVKEGYPSRFTFEYRGCERELSLITSRGCPYKCTFCGNYQHMGRKWRRHDIDHITKHMKYTIEKFDVKHFHIEDDNLSLNPKRFEAFLDMLIENDWGITWDTPNGIRAEGFSEEIVKKIVLSGCTYIIVGVESGSQRVVTEIVKKNLDLTKVVKAAQLAHKHKLSLHAFFIIGFPGETAKEIDQTLKFALDLLIKYNTIPHIGMARPLPGTELYDICKDNEWLTEPIIPDVSKELRGEVYEREMISTPEFTPELVEKKLGLFSKKMILIILLKTAIWFLLHPVKGVSILRYFFTHRDESFKVRLKRIFFGGMFYRENYLRIKV